MNPRVEYEMTQDDLEKILDACKPTPVMFLSGGIPFGNSPQENANHAWAELGKRMGFDYMTVRPGKAERFFTAIPSETEEQRTARASREETERRQKEILQHETAILEHQDALAKLRA